MKKSLFWLFTGLAIVGWACQQEFDNRLDPQNDAVIPEPPKDVEFEIQRDTAVVLIWKSDLHYGFKIERTIDGNKELLAIIDAAASVDGQFYRYIDRDFPINKEIKYTILSVLPNGKTAPLEVTVTVHLLPPSEFSATPLQLDGFRLNWQIPAKSVGNGYLVYGKAGNTSPFTLLATLPATATSFLWNRTVSIDTIYSFKIESFAVHRSSPTSEIVFEPAFLSPSSVQVTFQNDQNARVSWANISNIKTGFEIQLYLGSSWNTIRAVHADSTSAFVSRFFSTDTTYQFRVVTRAGAAANPSSVVSGRPFLQIPGNLKVSNAIWNRFTLTWSHVETWNSHYQIEYKRATDANFQELSRVPVSSKSAIVVITDTLSDSQVRVRAVTTGNRSEPTESILLRHLQRGLIEAVVKVSPSGSLPLFIQSFPERGELWVSYSGAAGIRRFTDGLSNETVVSVSDFTVNRFVYDAANKRMLAGGFTGSINNATAVVKSIDLATMTISDYFAPNPAAANAKISDFRYSEENGAFIYHVNGEGIKYQNTSTGAIWKTMESGLLDVHIDVQFNSNRVFYSGRRNGATTGLVGMYDYYTDQTWTADASNSKSLWASLSQSGDSLIVLSETNSWPVGYPYIHFFNAGNGVLSRSFPLYDGYVSGKRIPNSTRLLLIGKPSEYIVYMFDYALNRNVWSESFFHPQVIKDAEWLGGKVYVAKDNLVEMVLAYRWETDFLR